MQHMTPLRQSIIDLFKANHLMSAKEVLLSLEKKGSFINKTTVYRALEYLSQVGTLRKIQFVESDVLYETNADLHDHTFCTSCKTIEKTRRDQSPLTQIGSFRVSDQQLAFYGLCKKCAKAQQKSGNKQTLSSVLGL